MYTYLMGWATSSGVSIYTLRVASRCLLRPVMGLPATVCRLVSRFQTQSEQPTMHNALISCSIIMHPLEYRFGVLKSSNNPQRDILHFRCHDAHLSIWSADDNAHLPIDRQQRLVNYDLLPTRTIPFFSAEFCSRVSGTYSGNSPFTLARYSFFT